MQHIRALNDICRPFKRAVITIGNFDGVHIGHQALFYEVIERAHAIEGTSIAITFEPHPLRVLKKNAFTSAHYDVRAEGRTDRTLGHRRPHFDTIHT